MRRYAPAALLLLLTACGENYKPESLYQATTPACTTRTDVSRFGLPDHISLTAAGIDTVPGGVEMNLIYILPRNTKAQYVNPHFVLSHPKGAAIGNAEVVSIIERSENTKADILEVSKGIPMLMVATVRLEETQFRVKLRYQGKLPERFDLTPPALIINRTTYPVRTFTYRYFADRQAYAMCT